MKHHQGWFIFWHNSSSTGEEEGRKTGCDKLFCAVSFPARGEREREPSESLESLSAADGGRKTWRNSCDIVPHWIAWESRPFHGEKIPPLPRRAARTTANIREETEAAAEAREEAVKQQRGKCCCFVSSLPSLPLVPQQRQQSLSFSFCERVNKGGAQKTGRTGGEKENATKVLFSAIKLRKKREKRGINTQSRGKIVSCGA